MGSLLGQNWAGMQELGYHQGLQGTPVPPRTQAFISPHVCLAEAAWCSRGGRLRELDSLLVSCPCSPSLFQCWQRAAERAMCPWSCMFTIKAEKLP